MAKDALAEKELQLKKLARRRLVGAITAVVLLLIVLPFILRDRAENNPSDSVKITIGDAPSLPQAMPAADGTGFSSNVDATVVAGASQQQTLPSEEDVSADIKPTTEPPMHVDEHTQIGQLVQNVSKATSDSASPEMPVASSPTPVKTETLKTPVVLNHADEQNSANVKAKQAADKTLAQEKLAQEKLSQEKMAQAKLAEEKAKAEKLVRQKQAQEKLIADKHAQEKLAQEKATQEKAAVKEKEEKLLKEKQALKEKQQKEHEAKLAIEKADKEKAEKAAAQAKSDEKKKAELAALAKANAKPAEITKGKFYVQFGIFSDPKNISILQTKLHQAGFESVTENVDASGKKIRLRSKIFNTREEAANALKGIQASGLTGMVAGK